VISLRYLRAPELDGASQCDLDRDFAGFDQVRQIERASIRQFMEKHRRYLQGRVLDFGCGKMPYSDLVQGGQYIPFEIGDGLNGSPAMGPLDAIMCNQVLQYIEHVPELLRGFAAWLRPGGHLILTYVTNWDEVEDSDLWRFTKAGMERLLRDFGFSVIVHEPRARVSLGVFNFPLGYGCVAQK